jgi:hypothetical protein
MGEFIRWYFQDRPSCCLVAPDEDENPRFDMPWYVATLIEHDKDRGGEKEEENRASFPQFWKEKKDDI